MIERKEKVRKKEEMVIPHTEERGDEGTVEEPGKETEAAIEEREEKEKTEETGH